MAYRRLDDQRCYRGELMLGTMAGYRGPQHEVTPQQVASMVADFTAAFPGFAVCTWTRGTLSYGEGESETVIGLTVHNPSATEDEMVIQCERLATVLGLAFLQHRVYFDVIPMRTTVVGRS